MEAAILIAQAIQLALIIVGGFWLNYLVKQQLAAKDAEISYLKGLAAPELVAKIRAVSDFANEAQRTINDLTTKIESANRQLASANEQVEDARLTGFGSAMLQASQLSNNAMRKALDVGKPLVESEQVKWDDFESLLSAFDNLTSTLLEATRTTLAKLKIDPGR